MVRIVRRAGPPDQLGDAVDLLARVHALAPALTRSTKAREHLVTAIVQATRLRLQAYLRRALHSPSLTLDPPETQNGTLPVRVGDDVLGTVDQVDEEGERSWTVTLIVLEEDLH